MIYRLYCSSPYGGAIDAAMTVDAAPAKSFFFDPQNGDYVAFKAQILSDEAQLEDADGNLMTAEEAKAFVATLP